MAEMTVPCSVAMIGWPAALLLAVVAICVAACIVALLWALSI